MKYRIIAAALAAFFILPILGISALAAPDDDFVITGGGEDIVSIEGDIIEAETPAPEGIPEGAQLFPVIDYPDNGIPVTDYPDKYIPQPFTPAGTGTVVDHATDSDGKEFYTIKTHNENVFYLVIDRQRNSENVYFLNAVTEADLLSLAKAPERIAPIVTVQPPAPADTEPEPEQPTAPEKSGGNSGMMFMIVAIIVIGGGAGWYFKIYKPKRDRLINEDDYIMDGIDPYDTGDQDAEDDSPPWYEDEEKDADGGDFEDE